MVIFTPEIKVLHNFPEMKQLAFLLILASVCACGIRSNRTETGAMTGTGTNSQIEIVRADSLVFYYPNYASIDLVCQTMPEPSDSSILFCCEAAFTSELLDTFAHTNIDGDHVCGGNFYKGHVGPANTGCFAFYSDDKSWKFAMGDYSENLTAAAGRGGCAFGQAMVIFNGNIVVNPDKPDPISQTSINMYRVLAEHKGKLCIIDAEYNMSYGTFINKLSKANVSNALYLDMGEGWNYSYYRDNNAQSHYIHTKKIPYTTNWLVFKK